MTGQKIPPSSLCDDYGEISRQCDAFAPTLAKLRRLKAEIEAYYADADPELEYEAAGKLYQVTIGARANQRSIPTRGMKRLFRLLGPTKFLEWCTFKLTDLDRLVSDTKGIVEEERTGPRKVKAVALAAPASRTTVQDRQERAA